MKRFLPLLVAFFIVASYAAAAIVGSLPYTLTNGTTADATQVMANYNKIIADVNANAAKNGVNSDITALTGLTTPLSAAQGGSNVWYGGTSTGTANAQVVATLVPNNFSLVAGNTASFIASLTNTGATTLTLNGTSATNIFKRTPTGISALTGGEIVANTVTVVRYDGTQFQLISDVEQPLVGPLTNLASAATTDLGTIPSHNVNVTGTATITAFGSSANTTFPLFRLTFAGVATLTHNATSLILPGAANITTAANDHAWAMYLGSGNWQVLDYVRNVVPPQTGQLQGVQTFTANGTWTKPTGVNSALFICAGGGGAGGGSSDTAAGQGSAGVGGGAGAYAQLYKTAPAASYAITIPAAATGISDAAGNNGGNVTVGAILTCNGGTGGGRIAATGVTSVLAGGAGGTASGGDLNMAGAGGGPALSTADAAGNYYPTGGKGGDNPIGQGGAGGIATSGDGAANTGTGCGGGGGGTASALAPGTAHAGGAGAAGCVIVYAYY